jgi:MFS family permease
MNDHTTCSVSLQSPGVFYGWWIVLACFLISFYVGGIIFYGFTAFFEPLIREFGWSYTQVSFATSLRGIEMSLLSPVIGFLVDRFGPRRMVFWGVITIGLGFVLMSFTQSLWGFYASFILIAFGGGGCTVVVLMRVVANWFRRDVGKAMGVVSSGFGASGLMVPVLVWLIDAFGWRMAMVILGGGMIGIGVPLAYIIRNDPEPYGLSPDGRTVDAAGTGKPGREAETTEKVRFLDALRQWAFLCISLTEVLRMMTLSAVVIHIMPYLSLLAVSRTTAGLIAGSISVLSVAGRFGFGWLGDLFDKRYAMSIGYGMMCVGMFALCFVDTVTGLIFFLLFFPTGYGGLMVLRGAIVSEYFGREAFGRLLGFVMGASAGGAVIGPTLAGLVFDTWRSYTVTWIALAIGIAVSAILILSISPRKFQSHR